MIKPNKLKRAIQAISAGVCPLLLTACLNESNDNNAAAALLPSLGLDFPSAGAGALSTDGSGVYSLNGIALGNTTASLPETVDIYLNSTAEELLDPAFALRNIVLNRGGNTFAYWQSDLENTSADVLSYGDNLVDIATRAQSGNTVASILLTRGTSYMRESAIQQDISGNWFLLDTAQQQLLLVEEVPETTDASGNTIPATTYKHPVDDGTLASLSRRPVDFVWDQFNGRDRALVLDSETGGLIAVDSMGASTAIDLTDSSGNPLREPVALDIHENKIYLLDRGAHKIYSLDLNACTLSPCVVDEQYDGSFSDADYSSDPALYNLRLEKPMDLAFQPENIVEGTPDRLVVSDRRASEADALLAMGLDASGNLLDVNVLSAPASRIPMLADASGNIIPALRDASGNQVSASTVQAICQNEEDFVVPIQRAGALAIQDSTLYMLDDVYSGVVSIQLGHAQSSQQYTLNAISISTDASGNLIDASGNSFDASGNLLDASNSAVTIDTFCSDVGVEGEFSAFSALIDDDGISCGIIDAEGLLLDCAINRIVSGAALAVSNTGFAPVNPRMLVIDNSLGSIVEVELQDTDTDPDVDTRGQRIYLPGGRVKSAPQDRTEGAVASEYTALSGGLGNRHLVQAVPFSSTSMLAIARDSNTPIALPLIAGASVSLYIQSASQDASGNTIVPEPARLVDPATLALNPDAVGEFYVVDSATNKIIAISNANTDALRQVASSDVQSDVETVFEKPLAAVVSTPLNETDPYNLYVLDGSDSSSKIIKVELDIGSELDNSHDPSSVDNNRELFVFTGCAPAMGSPTLASASAMTGYSPDESIAVQYLMLADRNSTELRIIDLTDDSCTVYDYDISGTSIAVGEIVDIEMDFSGEAPAVLLLDKTASAVYRAGLDVTLDASGNITSIAVEQAEIVSAPGIPDNYNVFRSANSMQFDSANNRLYVLDDVLRSVYMVDLASRDPVTGERITLADGGVVSGQRFVTFRGTALNCDPNRDANGDPIGDTAGDAPITTEDCDF